ncbi:MAG TPA: hypothetical protein VIQ51_08610, partial [Chryseosolibacter sp.]
MLANEVGAASFLFRANLPARAQGLSAVREESQSRQEFNIFLCAFASLREINDITNRIYSQIMVTVSEATAIIFNNLFVPATTRVKLEGCIGKILAEGVTADRDFPPFNRVSMDGIAIQGQEWMNGQRSFIIEGMQAAGEKQTTLSDPAHCVEVMTGAVLPEGCDAVVRYEDLKINEHTAVIETDQVALWQSIHRQGMDAKKGEILLGPGQILAPSEVALLASTGHTEVSVFNFPK